MFTPLEAPLLAPVVEPFKVITPVPDVLITPAAKLIPCEAVAPVAGVEAKIERSAPAVIFPLIEIPWLPVAVLATTVEIVMLPNEALILPAAVIVTPLLPVEAPPWQLLMRRAPPVEKAVWMFKPAELVPPPPRHPVTLAGVLPPTGFVTVFPKWNTPVVAAFQLEVMSTP
jgi:hypothetical protein